MALEDVEGVAAEARDGLVEFLGVAGAERLGQQLDVGPAVPQRRRREHDDADAMVELLVEPALLDQARRFSLVDRMNRTCRRWRVPAAAP